MIPGNIKGHVRSSGLSILPQTQQYLDRMVVLPSVERIAAINTLIGTLIDIGAYDKFDFLHIFAGHDIDSCLINVIQDDHHVNAVRAESGWAVNRGIFIDSESTTGNILFSIDNWTPTDSWSGKKYQNGDRTIGVFAVHNNGGLSRQGSFLGHYSTGRTCLWGYQVTSPGSYRVGRCHVGITQVGSSLRNVSNAPFLFTVSEFSDEGVPTNSAFLQGSEINRDVRGSFYSGNEVSHAYFRGGGNKGWALGYDILGGFEGASVSGLEGAIETAFITYRDTILAL